eukprot:c5053_g1_i1.p1 GENE.c5053_g1_i1~~c5053_g1_i1.p1  ORF type:complete len:582 (+),score=95.76 c5053_g1_i1:57-1802(+)
MQVVLALLVLLVEARSASGSFLLGAIFASCICVWGTSLFCIYLLCKLTAAKGEHLSKIGHLSIPLPQIHLNADTFWVGALAAASVCLRCTNLSHPPHLLFDEVHFGKFVNNHINGKWYYDIHPPWVKLVMAWFLVTYTGYQGDQAFAEIGQAFEPTSPLKAFRFIPSLSSALLVPVTYLTARQLRISIWGSVLSASMFLLDNLLVTEGRMLTTDTSLLLFISLSFLTHVSADNQKLFSWSWYLYTALCGLFLGMTISTKWTGLSVIGVVGISTVCDLIYRSHLRLWPLQDFHINVKDFCVRLVLLLGIPIVFYLIMFWLWFYTCPRKGEIGHMSPAFQANLIGAQPKNKLPKPSFTENFLELNTAMFVGNKNILAPHHWQSYWYTWPVDGRGLNCWYSEYYAVSDQQEAVQQHVYFLGNPFVWWFALFCLCIGPFVLARRSWTDPGAAVVSGENEVSASGSSPSGHSDAGLTGKATASMWYRAFELYLGYISSILPYILVRRSCFIYHYMPSLFFALLATGLVCDHLLFLRTARLRPRIYFLVGAVLLFSWSFWFFGVFTYAVPITVDQFEARIWVDPGWR